MKNLLGGFWSDPIIDNEFQGLIPPLATGEHNLLEAPRGGKHSDKPNEVYDLIESCSYGPYLEIFSRHKRDGWIMWGSDAPC
jgi:N6-adenosine-specific RNA methylase IME4